MKKSAFLILSAILIQAVLSAQHAEYIQPERTAFSTRVENPQPKRANTGEIYHPELEANDQIMIAFRKEPYLVFTEYYDEMKVTWQLYGQWNCEFKWGLDTLCTSGTAITEEINNSHQHEYIISGLDQGEKYYYNVTVSNESHEGSFYTAPEENQASLKFISYGDTRSNPWTHDLVAASVVDDFTADELFQTFLFSVGDMVNNGNSESDWDNQFFSPSFPNIRYLMSHLPFSSSMGNHEGNGLLFKKYFSYPFLNDRYWSFEYGPALFVIIDQYVPYSPGTDQYTWIDSTLANSDKVWKFLSLHEPGWSAGGHTNNTIVQYYIQPLCEQYDVAIVFGGHNHYYARALVNDITHLTVGGGGAPLYTPNPSYPYIVTAAEANHYCKIEINGDILEAVVVKPDGSIIDEFTIDKSHSCLPFGITFSTQVEIDNFQTNNPNCTEIEGNVKIYGDEITNLNGLNVVTSIGGDLMIGDLWAGNPNLTSLTGLEDVTSIGGGLSISYNETLTTISGLESLTSIGGDLLIYGNNALISLTGLEGLTSIEEDLWIGQGLGTSANPSLTSLTGLDNLTSIVGDLHLHNNFVLTNLTGLGNLTSIQGNLSIGVWDDMGQGYGGNNALINLTGLDNLASIGGILSIDFNNALTSLTGVDNLTSIGGGLNIWSSESLTNLTGLGNLTYLGGELSIGGEFGNALTSLTGLEGLTFIEGNVGIGWNYNLTSLIGLENVSSIGGSLWIDGNALTSLSGLENLDSIDGTLSISYNYALNNLSELGNLDAGSIEDLTIHFNTSLATCEVQSICDYLASSSGTIDIHDNATGCNSPDEVELACAVSVDEIHLSDKLFIFPNPSSSHIIVELPNTPQRNSFLTIYNINSQNLIIRRITEQKTVVDVSGLPNGFYFVKVADDRTVTVGKLVKK